MALRTCDCQGTVLKILWPFDGMPVASFIYDYRELLLPGLRPSDASGLTGNSDWDSEGKRSGNLINKVVIWSE